MDLKFGEAITIDDAKRNRSVEIERDEFDGVYRITIKHDPENRTLWYHFDFEDEQRFNQFLKNKDLA